MFNKPHQIVHFWFFVLFYCAGELYPAEAYMSLIFRPYYDFLQHW